MENITKEHIVTQLRKEVDATSGNKAAHKIGISSATISHMLAGKWEKISDDLFRTVEKKLKVNHEWVFVETPESKLLNNFLVDAKENANVYGICAEAGYGKTEVTSMFSNEENVFVVSCADYFNRTTFLAELLTMMGKDSGGVSLSQMMTTITTIVNKADKPLLVFDEADKLSDSVLYFFITLYNKLQDKSGIILIATEQLEKRILKGIAQGKKGYAEIYSRLGRRFIHLPKYSKKSIFSIINANGITEQLMCTEIHNDSDGDVRRVKRLVHAKKLKSAA